VRILVDQDVYAVTLDLLKNAGHEASRVSQVMAATASDAEILMYAASNAWLS
jgi:predicted nuclease of predicted toxin-antitoxin system